MEYISNDEERILCEYKPVMLCVAACKMAGILGSIDQYIQACKPLEALLSAKMS